MDDDDDGASLRRVKSVGPGVVINFMSVTSNKRPHHHHATVKTGYEQQTQQLEQPSSPSIRAAVIECEAEAGQSGWSDKTLSLVRQVMRASKM